MIGLIILSMGAASFYSFFPVMSKTHQIGDSEQKATQIATKMLEHVQLLSPSKLDATTLSGMLLIDPNQVTPPFTFTHIPLDNGTDYSPATALKNGTGTLNIQDLNYGSKLVTVTVTWSMANGQTKSLSTGTIIGGYRQ
ncbi:MAG: hypothetical protein QOJ65_1795 [Fimbriimonadaceae bacterium]|jgi:hypothetical protein|nr:hypothetical protein [Fimbriimonadaceae bacterium]